MAVRVPKQLASRDPRIVAPLAGLRYLSADQHGWRRRRRGSGYQFINEAGLTIRDPERSRLSGLAVPPAWEDVWFAPLADGYLQATGTDAAGRKQYRYHDDYRAMCEARKFERMTYFGRALPGLRSFIRDALAHPPDSPEIAIGAVLSVIDTGLLRVGNEQSSHDGRYGATTLETDHLEIGEYVTLTYRGKGGKARQIVIENEDLTDVLESFSDTSERRLFSYLDSDGRRRPVTATEINAAIAEVAGPSFAPARSVAVWVTYAIAMSPHRSATEPFGAPKFTRQPASDLARSLRLAGYSEGATR